MDKGTALRLVNRKYRSWQNWRATDEYFREVDDKVPELSHRLGGEARVLRTALLDISIVETGISIFRKIMRKEPVTDGMWAYAVKMAGLRIPMMNQAVESGNPWERIANSIKSTIAQRDVMVTRELDGTETIRARETVVQEANVPVQPSPEQQKMANDIVQRILHQAKGESY
uniref:Uncharacterized protein n=1 Tax=viral metagenome TaxID=1070528 RepID=A0A6M3JBQ1_9ZZZZ